MSALIHIENLSFDYPAHRALTQINLSLMPNTITALVGPNGAGKSTLMRCIAGLEMPSLGTIWVDGLNVTDHPRQVHQRIGYLSDLFGLYDELTLAQSLSHAGASQGLALEAIPYAVAQTIARLNLVDKTNVKVGQLSRGQRQRVAIGQAIIHQPKILILDEPASGLDPEARQELSFLFKQLQQDGITLLVSSHILAELEEYCTHMLALRDGKVIAHRAIGGGDDIARQAHEVNGHTQQLIPILIKLSKPASLYQVELNEWSGIFQQVIDANTIRCLIEESPIHRTNLLKYLLDKNVPVIGLEVIKENLLSSYQHSIEQYQPNGLAQ